MYSCQSLRAYIRVYVHLKVVDDLALLTKTSLIQWDILLETVF